MSDHLSSVSERSSISERYISPKKAAEIIGVSQSTLRTWDRSGTISSIRTPSNMRRYDMEDVLKIVESMSSNRKKRKKVVYCRVSSKKQMDDLKRQENFLLSKYPYHFMVRDIGSGINWKRKGLQTILELSMHGELEELVVSHRDRLCRFAFELIEWIIKSNGGRVIVLDNEEYASKSHELAKDLVKIVKIFNIKERERKHSDKKDKNKTNNETKRDSKQLVRD